MEAEHTSQRRTSTTAGEERCDVDRLIVNDVSHLIHLRNTLLHDHNIWESLQVPNSMRYAHGKLRADIICALKGCLTGKSQVK